MALANYTLPFGGLGSQGWSATISPIQQHATAVNNLLYGPAGHQESDSELDTDATNEEYYKNDPYATPSHRVTQQNYRRNNNEYLPPVPIQYNTQPTRSQTRSQYQTQTTRTYGEGSYSNSKNNAPQRTAQPPNTPLFNNYNNQRVTYSQTPTATPQPNTRAGSSSSASSPSYPQQAPGFTKVNAGQGSRTQVHAVLDYDGDENDYYDDHGHDQGKSVHFFVCVNFEVLILYFKKISQQQFVIVLSIQKSLKLFYLSIHYLASFNVI